MFCQLFSLQNKSFLCLQYVENKGFQTVTKHRLKAIQKPIKNELGNREKNTENAHFVLKKCTFRFRDYISFSLNSDSSCPKTRFLCSSPESGRFFRSMRAATFPSASRAPYFSNHLLTVLSPCIPYFREMAFILMWEVSSSRTTRSLKSSV